VNDQEPDRDRDRSPAVERISFLNEAASLLTSLDYNASLGALAKLVVPAIADWWMVDLLEKDGAIRRAVAYGGPAENAARTELEGRYAPWPDAPSGPCRVMQTGRVETLVTISDPAQIAVSRDAKHLATLRRLGMASAICVPIAFRGRILGAMTFARGKAPYRPAHIVLARTLGGRVGQSITHGQMYEEVQNASRAKDEFLAMLGHELRNPLAAITNAVAVLRSPFDVPRETQETITAIIARQANHLTKLVAELLDVARLTSGKVLLETALTDLLGVAERSLATLRSAGKGDGHAIRLAGKTVFVVGDPVRLEQVLDNLLDNAVKYTPPGGRIDVSVEADGGEAMLRVRDTGVGVAADLLPRMFDLFEQGPQGIERPQGGLGLGLAIVRRLVELHGGAVFATSPGPGAGTEIVVRLPLAKDGFRAAGREKPASASLRRYRVLVVEDNADAREALRFLLEQGGHQVALAEDGLAGLDLALHGLPEVALIDLGLPGLDGYDVARRIRAAPGRRTIGLIALTGYGSPRDRERAKEAGFDAYLVKPVDRDVLERALSAAAATADGPATAR
jgi:signal transduction histidine kinase/CheY-like chemotaxis protein